MTPALVHYAAVLVAALTLVAVPYALRLVAKRTKPGALRDALLLAAEVIGIGVRDAAVAVAELKDPSKPGEWTAAAAAAVKERVIADARAAAPGAIAALEAAAADPGQADALLSRLVESELAKFRASAAAPVVNVSLPPSAPTRSPT